MHIAMVTDYYLPSLGGVQTAIKSAKEALEHAGHTVTVFCPRFEPSADPTVVALDASPIFKPDGYPFTWPFDSAYALLTKHFRESEVDVVHVHSEMFAALAGLRAARDLGIPTVQTMHGRVDVYSAAVLPLPAVSTILLARLHARRIPHSLRPSRRAHYSSSRVARRMWALMVNQANFADRVIVPSQHFAQKLLDQGVSRPVSVVSNGLEASVLRRVGSYPSRSRSSNSPLRIMWCGRVSPEKRPEVLIRALTQLSVPFEANLYGEGVAFSQIGRLVKRLGLESKVKLHGAVSQEEVLDAMREHDVFVSTSYDFDNQPMVLIEAIASALPVVVMDPDLAEMFPSSGVVITATEKPESLTASLEELAKDRTRLQDLSQALANAEEQVSQNSYVVELEAVYGAVSRQG